MKYTSRMIFDNKLQMLERELYRGCVDITGWTSEEVIYTEPLVFEKLSGPEPIGFGDHWLSAHDHTRFFRAAAILPDFGGRHPLLVLDLGGEGLVRINGEIISAVTSYVNANHLTPHQRSRVYIPDKYKPGDRLEIEVESCLNFLEATYTTKLSDSVVWTEYTFKCAFFAAVDEEFEKYIFDLRNAVEAMDTFANPLDTLQESNARILDPTVQNIMKALNSGEFYHKRIYNAVNRSVAALEFEYDYDTLLKSAKEASDILAYELSRIPHKATAMIKLVGQAHIDTAWLWPLKESVRKCAKTFSNTLALMEKYPEYIFAFSQPQLFMYLEEFYPDLFEKVRQRVIEGRIELVGNAWVEMDTNVPSGESLVRQLLYGRRYFLDRFGKASRVFWMPDVFGYSWSLPQIMKRSGVDYFFTSKLNNNDTNNFPHSLFIWQGVDGTRILSYLQKLNYNGNLNADTLSRINALYPQKDVTDEVLMTVGYGDGGGGISYQMLENGRRLRDFPGLPESGFATAVSFFDDVNGASADLPVWNDEMYYEFHRGTYTSQANNKKSNRKNELLLRKTEIACAMANVLCGAEYPMKELTSCWQRLLTNQFHDILPGSSIHQVYEDTARIYADIKAEAEQLFKTAFSALNGHIGLMKGQIAVWNFLSWSVTGLAEAVIDGEKYVFEAEDVPPMGCRIYSIDDIRSAVGGLTADDRHLENSHMRVTFDDNGNITSLYDKDAGREAFAKDSVNNLLTVFEDIPHRESAWNIDEEYQNHYTDLVKAESVRLIERGPARAVIRVERRFDLSKITQDIVLARSAKRLDFVTRVDWRETEKMLKTAFAPDVLASSATYEIQFGAIQRPTHRNTSYDKARFEVCGHKWADLSEGGWGLSLLNDCKYGYDIKDNRMRLTLLRAPIYPDHTGDKGVHEFTYSIYPHSGSWQSSGTINSAYELNVPLEAAIGTTDEAGAEFTPFITSDRSNVVIDTVKLAESGSGIVVRVYEAAGIRGRVNLKTAFPFTRVTECNLMEDRENIIAEDGSSFGTPVKPFEIKTFLIER